MEHIRHHHTNSLLVAWLLTILALTIERLYRLRYLHRGRHRPLTPIEFLRLLRLSLSPLRPLDTSDRPTLTRTPAPSDDPPSAPALGVSLTASCPAFCDRSRAKPASRR